MISELDRSWKSVCKVLLGSEIGPLVDYEGYLTRYVDPLSLERSALSGKSVVVSSTKLPKNARFLAQDEIERYLSGVGREKFDVGSLKDIDSAIQTLRERAYYVGNVVLGNSQQVETVNRCINSSFVFHTQDVYDCKYVAYSSNLRFAEYIFGGNAVGEGSKFNIKTFETYKNVRCMETIRNYVVSDCYFTGNLEGCTNCMFSFNQRKKSNLIGNREFTRDEYQKLKEKLVADIRDTLMAKKSVPSLIDIINGAAEENTAADGLASGQGGDA